jgi:REP element-mobilizing transposase RayT
MTGMPRQLRLECPGAMYHVMSRGDRREQIFLDDADRHDFIKTLAEACHKTGWRVHACCLTPGKPASVSTVRTLPRSVSCKK